VWNKQALVGVVLVLAVLGGWLLISQPFQGKTFHGTAVVVSKDSFDGEWPFTVPSGDLICTDDHAVSFEVGTTRITRYALNTAAHIREARQRRDGTPGPTWGDVALIRAVDANGLPAKLGPIIKQGLTYCDPNFEP
jgi:hypothetical protein